jgi:hypothetical protein
MRRRTTDVIVELPAWIRAYDPAAWPSIYVWSAAADNWFDTHPEAEPQRWTWILSIPDEPFDPYAP